MSRSTAIPSSTPKKTPVSHFLFWYFVAVNMVPNFYFFFHQSLNLPGRLAALLFSFGMYMLLFSAVKNTGKCLIFLLPLLVLHAFQIVLFFLYGQGLIAPDMFLNVVTTNGSEVGELLGSLTPAIVSVCLLYIPALIIGGLQWGKSSFRLRKRAKRYYRRSALACLLLGLMLSFFGTHDDDSNFSFTGDIYPVNMLYNLKFAVQQYGKIANYPRKTKDFSYQAHRASDANTDQRQIVVLVVGETSRADNWQLYGYSRETTPRLANMTQLVTYSDALTLSNVTFKSVPMILSSVGAVHHGRIFRRKSIFEAFKEGGFTSVCITNQAESHSLIAAFTKSADSYKPLRVIDPKTGERRNPYDGEMIPVMKKIIDTHPGNLFLVLHSYGSHFNYKDRYPASFAKFKPDQVTEVGKSQKQKMINAYDNSILYTDSFLAQVIATLKKTSASALLLYTSDHGEDLYDDARERFLHASPKPTYYQLHIPFLMWFSKTYIATFPQKFAAAKANRKKPIATHNVFPTLLEAAHIDSPYLQTNQSLVSKEFKPEPRWYLNTHNRAVPYTKELNPQDLKMLKIHHIAQ